MKLKSVGASYAFIGSTYVGKVHKPSCVDQVALDTGKGPAVISKLVGLNSNSQGTYVDIKKVTIDKRKHDQLIRPLLRDRFRTLDLWL